MNEKPVQPTNKEPLENEVSALGLHAQQMREIADPYEAPSFGPKWFYLFIVFSMVVGAFYLGRHMGKLDATAHIGFLDQKKPAADTSAATAAQPAASGQALFTSKCVSCHQADGKGVPGVFPPLEKSEFVLGNPERLISIVLRGVSGPMEVEGQTFNGAMPAWADQMTDQEITAVVNHVRNGLGSNQAGEVSQEQVEKVRKDTEDRTQPWTAEELEGKYS